MEHNRHFEESLHSFCHIKVHSIVKLRKGPKTTTKSKIKIQKLTPIMECHRGSHASQSKVISESAASSKLCGHRADYCIVMMGVKEQRKILLSSCIMLSDTKGKSTSSIFKRWTQRWKPHILQCVCICALPLIIEVKRTPPKDWCYLKMHLIWAVATTKSHIQVIGYK